MARLYPGFEMRRIRIGEGGGRGDEVRVGGYWSMLHRLAQLKSKKGIDQDLGEHTNSSKIGTSTVHPSPRRGVRDVACIVYTTMVGGISNV